MSKNPPKGFTPEYPALRRISDQTETISVFQYVPVCSTGTPPESRNADLEKFVDKKSRLTVI